MATFIALLLTVIVLGVFIFGALAYPIWMLIHCATAQRSTKSKAIWIILMVLIWPIASYFYGLFASKRKLFKWFSSILIVLLAFLVFVFVSATAYLTKFTDNQLTLDISRLSSNQIIGLTDEESAGIKENLETLRNDLKGGMLITDKKFIVYNLARMFDIISADNQVNQSELTDWMDKFESRDTLDRNAFEKYVDDLGKTKQ